MEGPNLRDSPRTLLCCPVELRAGNKTVRLKEIHGNLSPQGLFVDTEELPVDAAVHVKIGSRPPFEAEGIVRFCGGGGVGIEFTQVSKAHRRRLDELIAEAAQGELLSADS